MFGNTVTIYVSYMYPASTGPRYILAGSANAVICLVVASLALILRFIHIRENKKLEKAEREADASGSPNQGISGFRYIY
jgi:hypothetical protein